MNIDFRPAWPDEVERTLRAFSVPLRPEPNVRLFVASASQPRERVLGCVAVAYAPAAEDGSVGARGYLQSRILPAYQGEALETDLLKAAVAYFQGLSDAALVSKDCLPEDHRQALLLQGLGFQPAELIDEYQASYQSVWDRCRRIHDLLQKRNAIPAEADVSSFTARWLPQIRAVFHNNHIINSVEFDSRSSGSHGEPLDLERSTAIIMNGQLIGAMAVYPIDEGRGYLVSGRWVAPGHRQSWVNAKLIYNSVRYGESIGVEFVRFVANRDVHHETARLAERLGGSLYRRLQRYELKAV